MNGGYIIQRVDENLTYDYLHSSEENLWSLMYLTGYLTQVRDYKIDDGWQDNMVALKIPNLEIKQIFETEVSKWFEDSSKKWNRTEFIKSVAWYKKQESLRTTTGNANRLLFHFSLNHRYQYVPARTPIGDRICQ